MALKTKSIYEPRETADGQRVLITRFYPRGVKSDKFDRWVKELSPSRELLRSYRSGEKSWDQFKLEFVSEMGSNPASLEAIRKMRRESKKGTVTILCFEKTGLPCHRYIVADMVKRLKLPTE